MNKSVIPAIVLAFVPLSAFAGSFDTAADPVLIAPAPASPPDLIFKLRGGISGGPEYFGSSTMKPGVDLGFSLEYARLPFGKTIGSADPDALSYGLVPRGSFRLIQKRSSDDHPELTGLNDVDLSVELGLGFAYKQRNFEAFADARYGVVGHNSWVGEVGADLVLHPSEQLTLKIGPRVLFGSDRYASTYFGVTAAEAAASGGAFTAFDASGGALSAGLQLGAVYALSDTWGLEGAVRWDKYTGDARNSPIIAQGDDNQVTVRLGLTRRFSLSF